MCEGYLSSRPQPVVSPLCPVLPSSLSEWAVKDVFKPHVVQGSVVDGNGIVRNSGIIDGLYFGRDMVSWSVEGGRSVQWAKAEKGRKG